MAASPVQEYEICLTVVEKFQSPQQANEYAAEVKRAVESAGGGGWRVKINPLVFPKGRYGDPGTGG